jgi:hypothetical protein
MEVLYQFIFITYWTVDPEVLGSDFGGAQDLKTYVWFRHQIFYTTNFFKISTRDLHGDLVFFW